MSELLLEKPTAQYLIELCIKKFKNLPKKGKPLAGQEWTVLAGIILYDVCKKDGIVVALGTGTKCIALSRLCLEGYRLNDSHAEIMARRAFIRYLYYEMNKACNENVGDSSIFIYKDSYFKLDPMLSFHFVSTQVPCGDACIEETQLIPTTEDEEDDDDDDDDNDVIPAKRRKTDAKIELQNLGIPLQTIYTGARMIDSNHNDTMKQIIGALRTKPGRGERTLSMCCSDKISKWCILGVQGALLDLLLTQPIYFETLNFYCSTQKLPSLKRAFYGRWLNRKYQHARYKRHIPDVRCYDGIKFDFEQNEQLKPSPNSIVWYDIPEKFKSHEVAVNGLNMGSTKDKGMLLQAALNISKIKLEAEFRKLLQTQPMIRKRIQMVDNFTCEKKFGFEPTVRTPYNYLKMSSIEYQKAWKELKLRYFRSWIDKKCLESRNIFFL